MGMDLSVFHNLPISFKQCSFFVVNFQGYSDDRSAEVSADVFNGDIGSAEIWLCADIKTFGMFLYISFLTLRKAGPIREESCSSSTLRKALRRKP